MKAFRAKEDEYCKTVGRAHLKAMGQFFTPQNIAAFMCRWAGKNARNMLDPAAGNSIFLQEMKGLYPECQRKGYELDARILECFGNPSRSELVQGDYLTLGWEERYDAIVANPPYNRFQAVANRDRLLQGIYEHTGLRCHGNSNLYVLFLLKSIFQMSDRGRLAYLVPTEFLNSAYGEPIKAKLLKERLLRAVICFEQDDEVFQAANTTCCILLLDREPKEQLAFYSLYSPGELEGMDAEALGDISTEEPENKKSCVCVPYTQISPREKWRRYLRQEKLTHYNHLVPVAKYCRISRGIATGANSFFCLTASEAAIRDILPQDLTECICQGRDVAGCILDRQVLADLALRGKRLYLLDIKAEPAGGLLEYIRQGEAAGLPSRYILSQRQPWYAMEQQEPAPILISTAYRGRIKVVRNLAGVKYLTAFHGVYIKPEFAAYRDIIFCYLLTEAGQEILRRNRKEMGRGLKKFQPGDLQQGQMLDMELLAARDMGRIEKLYRLLLAGQEPEAGPLGELEKIFLPYLLSQRL